MDSKEPSLVDEIDPGVQQLSESTDDVPQEYDEEDELSVGAVKRENSNMLKAMSSASKSVVSRVANAAADSATHAVQGASKTISKATQAVASGAEGLAKAASSNKKKDKKDDDEDEEEGDQASNLPSATDDGVVANEKSREDDQDDEDDDTSSNSSGQQTSILPDIHKEVHRYKAPNSIPVEEDPIIELDDRMICYIIMFCTIIVTTMDNLEAIQNNQVPLSAALSWTFAAFVAGMSFDDNLEDNFLQIYVLRMVEADDNPKETHECTNNIDESIRETAEHESRDSPLGDETEGVSTSMEGVRTSRQLPFLQNMLKGHVKLPNVRLTSLDRSKPLQERQNRRTLALVDKALMQRLANRFRRSKRSRNGDDDNMRDGLERTPSMPSIAEDAPATDEELTVESDKEDSHMMGSYNGQDTVADVLQQKIEFEPLFKLRGLDVFLTDCAEPIMGTHPVLLQSGLRDVPTFMMNLMTQFGTILIYFEMPSWVKDFDESLIEEESDSDEVKALKRFLSGDDDYRKARLKAMPEIVVAPYPVRLMSPSGVETSLNKPGFLENSYHLHNVENTDGDKQLCPVLEMTMDMMGNSTIRRAASLVKRYLRNISIDMAIVLGIPDDMDEDEAENEPEACLGLFRMNHIDVTKHPQLPERFSTDMCSEETINTMRATELAETVAS